MAVSSKVRIYDLAKELKLDTKRLIEEVRREGVDVSVPSNHVSKELAEKIRNKYFPKKETSVKRAVKVVKRAVLPTPEAPVEEEPPIKRAVRVLRPTERAVKVLRPTALPSPAAPVAEEPEVPVAEEPEVPVAEAPEVPVAEAPEMPADALIAPVADASEAPVSESPVVETIPEVPVTTEVADESKGDQSEDHLLPLSIDAADDILVTVRQLVPDYAGVILSGPPGTSKTWYARQIAAALTDRDRKRVRFVQFHQSYQYEDFVEGFVPREDGNGFQLRPKHLLEMCEVSRGYQDQTCVIIIDELSRSDPGRVFGEALTYIEPTQREVEFYLASGNPVKIPRNLFFLATMNPLDRGVDEVDAALDRRFAKIAMEPSAERLAVLLDQNSLDEQLKNLVLRFFRFLLTNQNERCRVGHAYFRAIRSQADLQRLWDHQLRFHMAKAFKLDSESYRNIEREWNRTFPPQTK
jgi:5-methylcytosine-specific restriction protein B